VPRSSPFVSTAICSRYAFGSLRSPGVFVCDGFDTHVLVICDGSMPTQLLSALGYARTVATSIRGCYPQWPSGLCGCYLRSDCYLYGFSAMRPSSFLLAFFTCSASGISGQAVGVAHPFLSPFALRAIRRRVMCELPSTRDRTSRFPLYAYTELFDDGFCPPGRLRGCSVSPTFGAGSSASAQGIVFVVFARGFCI
jgi:hypothetical protein